MAYGSSRKQAPLLSALWRPITIQGGPYYTGGYTVSP